MTKESEQEARLDWPVGEMEPAIEACYQRVKDGDNQGNVWLDTLRAHALTATWEAERLDAVAARVRDEYDERTRQWQSEVAELIVRKCASSYAEGRASGRAEGAGEAVAGEALSSRIATEEVVEALSTMSESPDLWQRFGVGVITVEIRVGKALIYSRNHLPTALARATPPLAPEVTEAMALAANLADWASRTVLPPDNELWSLCECARRMTAALAERGQNE